jgi:3',5'-cyclic-AMP phosphodiesterase
VDQRFVLVQLSDPHIGAEWTDADPVAGLAATVEAVRRLRSAPDAVLLTGDLAENAADAEYERVRELVAPLGAALYALPGNHDDRAALRRHFEAPGTEAEPVQYSASLGPLRLVALDTTLPGEDRGELGPERLAWLEEELAEEADVPTLIAMHHPPLVTGVPAMDEIGLPAADREGLARVVERHPQVRRLVGGHVHRTIAAQLGGRGVLAVPSTYVQLRLELGSRELAFADEPRGFAVHALLDGELVSHVQPVA